MDKQDILRMLDDKDHLAHYGIKGQEWGKRRFQNEDGSLTPEGRRRYGVGQLSDQELVEAVNRKRLEAQYERLKKGNKKKKVSKEEVFGLINDIDSTLSATGSLLNNTIVPASKYILKRDIEETRKENAEKIKENELRIKEKKALDEADPYHNHLDLEKEINTANEEIDNANKRIEEDKQTIKLIDPSTKLIKDTTKMGKQMAVAITNLAYKIPDSTVEALDNDKPLKDMNTDELRKKINRLMMEQEYENLVNPPKPSAVARGREVFQTIAPIISLAATAAGLVLTVTMIKAIKSGRLSPMSLVHSDIGDINMDSNYYLNLGIDIIKHIDDAEEYLAHYGIPGQKRGVRRYQNEDGTLTPEGYRHYGIDPNGRASAEATSGQLYKYARDVQRDNYNRMRKEGITSRDARRASNTIANEKVVNAYGKDAVNYNIRRDRQRYANMGLATMAGGVSGALSNGVLGEIGGLIGGMTVGASLNLISKIKDRRRKISEAAARQKQFETDNQFIQDQLEQDLKRIEEKRRKKRDLSKQHNI